MILEFEPFNKSCASLVTPPKSAKHYLPEWYKRIKTVYNINEYDDELSCPFNNSPELNKVLTAKTCVPTLESFTIGYIQETWVDIEVTQDTKNANYAFLRLPNFSPEIPTMIKVRPSIEDRDNAYFIPNDYYQTEYTWMSPWFPKTPKEYSLITIHPINRNDLPFTTIGGIIDTDTYWGAGSIPFFIKKGFSGLIPKGTPMYQMIPLKRDNWQSVVKETSSYEEFHPIGDAVGRGINGTYKNKFWQKKVYE